MVTESIRVPGTDQLDTQVVERSMHIPGVRFTGEEQGSTPISREQAHTASHVALAVTDAHMMRRQLKRDEGSCALEGSLKD